MEYTAARKDVNLSKPLDNACQHEKSRPDLAAKDEFAFKH